MALTFPVPATQFWGLLPISSLTFDLPETVTASRTRGGEVLMAEVGARLWGGEVRLDLMTADEATAIQPLLEALRGAGRPFVAYHPLRAFPARDPRGTTLGAAAVKIASLPSARELTLKGLPAGYVLTRGDFLAYNYAANPARYALHRIVSTVTASGTGITPAIEVVPPLRGGAVDTPVNLGKPACKALIVPGTVDPGTTRRGGLVEGASFRFQQTLR